MAAGDITVFNVHLQDIGRAVHNLESGDISLGLIVDETTPTASTTGPAWGEGVTTDLSDAEVTPGGSYSADGPSIGGTYSQTSGTATFDVTDVDIEQNGSNPTDARWAIVYNETASNNEAIAFLDLGTNIDLSAGDFSITWSANGIYQIS
jgi:hypothetical protein